MLRTFTVILQFVIAVIGSGLCIYYSQISSKIVHLIGGMGLTVVLIYIVGLIGFKPPKEPPAKVKHKTDDQTRPNPGHTSLILEDVLRQLDCRRAYTENLTMYGPNNINSITGLICKYYFAMPNIDDYVKYAFPWASTAEGYFYWKNVSNAFKNHYRSFCKLSVRPKNKPSRVVECKSIW